MYQVNDKSFASLIAANEYARVVGGTVTLSFASVARTPVTRTAGLVLSFASVLR